MVFHVFNLDFALIATQSFLEPTEIKLTQNTGFHLLNKEQVIEKKLGNEESHQAASGIQPTLDEVANGAMKSES
jgi:hypothetical protein